MIQKFSDLKIESGYHVLNIKERTDYNVDT
jgi:hypothetical protein